MPKRPNRTTVTIRIEETLYAEMFLLNPELQDHLGYTKYGALSEYFTQLIRKDLSRIKDELRQTKALPMGVPQ